MSSPEDQSQSTTETNEKNAGVETIRHVRPLLNTIIRQEKLAIQMGNFTRRFGVYNDPVSRGSKNQQEGISPKILKKIARLQELEKEWGPPDQDKEIATFIEQFIVLFAAKLDWLGSGTETKLSTDIDNVERATDGIALLRKSIEGEPVLQSIAYDSTSFAVPAVQKVSNLLVPFVDKGLLTSLQLAESSARASGGEIRGQQDIVPHFVLVVSHQTAFQIAKLIEEEGWDTLAVHPVQTMLLAQLRAQAYAYHEYALRNTQFGHRRQIVLESFERSKVLIDHILAEREEVLKAAKANPANEEISALLGSGVSDPEHNTFIKLFKKKGADQARRLEVLANMRPPVRRNPDTKAKEPMYPPKKYPSIGSPITNATNEESDN